MRAGLQERALEELQRAARMWTEECVRMLKCTCVECMKVRMWTTMRNCSAGRTDVGAALHLQMAPLAVKCGRAREAQRIWQRVAKEAECAAEGPVS